MGGIDAQPAQGTKDCVSHMARFARRTKERKMEQLHFIDWPALEKLLTPSDRDVYENLKSCQTLMSSESPNHEEVSKQIRAGEAVH